MDTIDRIFDLLDKSGVEQKEFAEAIGTTPNKVSEWKARKTKSYNKYLHKIASFFNVDINYLLCVTDEKNKPTVNYDELDDETKKSVEVLKKFSPKYRQVVLKMLEDLAAHEKGQE
ncbi:MAG: helix-turn-helix transcriptional regulator [Bacillota bacterium]|nr:helix-turn-helix transcriptional regulator [Bacillota bacterium]